MDPVRLFSVFRQLELRDYVCSPRQEDIGQTSEQIGYIRLHCYVCVNRCKHSKYEFFPPDVPPFFSAWRPKVPPYFAAVLPSFDSVVPPSLESVRLIFALSWIWFHRQRIEDNAVSSE